MRDKYDVNQAGVVGPNAKVENVQLNTRSETGQAASGSSAPIWERIAIFIFGVSFVISLLAIAVFFPYPAPFQYTVFRIVLALAAAGVAALIPGFIEVSYRTAVRAGGALAVFVIVYFFSPAALVSEPSPSPTDPFVIAIINDDSGKLKSNIYKFPIGDIEKRRNPAEFIKLLSQLPGQGDNIRESVIFRLNDEQVITENNGDPLLKRNKGVLVIPRAVLERFPDSHVAFTYVRSQLPQI
jgi:hypothetical protein